MLLRTSSLIPGALFTPLPGDCTEHLSDTKRVSTPSALKLQPTTIIGHRPRPKARLRDRNLDRIRAALRSPARIHRPRSLSRRGCGRTGRCVFFLKAFARDLHASCIWPHCQCSGSTCACAKRMRTWPFGWRGDR